MKFGFYMEQPYQKKKNTLMTNKCFVYSLNLKKIYNTKENTYCLNDGTGYIINLYYQPIWLSEKCLNNDKSYTCTKSNADNSYYGFEKDYELNNGEQNFTVQEIETFQILFN
jgi:hypothetical protein